MKYVGLDYGSSRIGIAVSDEAGSFAFPRDTLENNEHVIEKICAIVAELNPAAIVVGDTKTMAGEGNEVTQSADAFCAALSAVVEVPVERSREAWSSFEAARFAPKGKTHDDAAAAAIILQRYLDMKGGLRTVE